MIQFKNISGSHQYFGFGIGIRGLEANADEVVTIRDYKRENSQQVLRSLSDYEARGLIKILSGVEETSPQILLNQYVKDGDRESLAGKLYLVASFDGGSTVLPVAGETVTHSSGSNTFEGELASITVDTGSFPGSDAAGTAIIEITKMVGYSAISDSETLTFSGGGTADLAADTSLGYQPADEDKGRTLYLSQTTAGLASYIFLNGEVLNPGFDCDVVAYTLIDANGVQIQQAPWDGSGAVFKNQYDSAAVNIETAYVKTDIMVSQFEGSSSKELVATGASTDLLEVT